jgi:SPP1 gp7 family putative phage head morphogenesis protein
MPTTAEAIRLPFKEAIDYFRQKVSVPSAHWTAVMDEAHARAFAVAGATDKALIADLRGAVDTAIAEGRGFGAFQKEFDTIVKRHGWVHHGHPQWRAKVIYETNMATAAAAGRYAQATDPDVLAAYPYWEWYHTPVQRPRPQHVAWNGLILRADDPFWSTHYPPCGWGCRCIVYSVSEGDLKRRGKSGPDASPKIEWRDYINKTTGVVVKVPTGVDPGFVGNPGKIWKEGGKAQLTAPKVTPVGPPAPVLAPPGERAVSPATLRAFVHNPEGAIQIGTLPRPLREAIGAKTDVVQLSSATMRKQRAFHEELTIDDYAAVSDLLDHPDVAYTDRDMHVVALRVGKRLLMAVVKATGSGAACFLQSLHWADRTRLPKLIGKGRVLIDRLGDIDGD